MSRIGRAPIVIPAGVSVRVEGDRVEVQGPRGELAWTKPASIGLAVEDGRVTVSRTSDESPARALHGTTRSLIAGMVKGVSEGYRKELEIQGVGYRAQVQGARLVMHLGFSHPIEFDVPPGVTVEVADGTRLVVSGADKQQVGEVSARLRGFHKAEPYKGKGVRYKDEHVRRKAGKTVG